MISIYFKTMENNVYVVIDKFRHCA